MLASTTCRACWSDAITRDPGDPGTVRSADRIGHAAPDLDVIQVARNEDAPRRRAADRLYEYAGRLAGVPQGRGRLRVATLLATPLAGVIELPTSPCCSCLRCSSSP